MEAVVKINELNTTNWSHKLGTIGEVVTEADDIAQCYATIFKTQKGTVVLNPNLGWPALELMSRPLNEVTHIMRTNLMRELNWQEPRGEVTDIIFSYPEPEQGRLSAEINYTEKLTGKNYSTGVTL